MLNISQVKTIYSNAYKEHGDSIKSLFIPKGRQKERFDVLTSYINNDGFTILDYGCGLAHLKQYLEEKFSDYTYTGVDIVNEFIDENTKKFKDAQFQLINEHQEIVGNFDFIISAGVFNILYDDSFEKQQYIIEETLTHLFSLANKVLSVDFMTDQVDFIQENNYHQNVVQIYNFASKNLSKRLVIDQSYMPYEFTIHIFKDDGIVRPDNIYLPV